MQQRSAAKLLRRPGAARSIEWATVEARTYLSAGGGRAHGSLDFDYPIVRISAQAAPLVHPRPSVLTNQIHGIPVAHADRSRASRSGATATAGAVATPAANVPLSSV